MLTESSPKVAGRYVCAACDYSTCKSSNWAKHVATHKHRMLTQANSGSRNCEETEPVDGHACPDCGRVYKHRASLSRHRRKPCAPRHEGTEGSPRPMHAGGAATAPEVVKSSELAELRAKAALYDKQCESVKELKDLVKKVAEQRVTTHNTTNNLNINVILEKQCPTALNITDFVNSLRLTLEDLSYTQQNGFAKGVSNVFIRNLQEMQPAARPIHCADKQGRQLYIRDDNKWEADAGGRLLDMQIGIVTKKQLDALKAWEAANRDWRESEEGTQGYMALVQKLTGGASEAEKERNLHLIQREIGRSCAIDDLVIASE